MRLHWTQRARENRLAITRYIANDNPDAAKRVKELIRNAANGLLLYPQKGRIGRVQGTRELVVHSNYILVYTLQESVISILAVLHAAQQYPSG